MKIFEVYKAGVGYVGHIEARTHRAAEKLARKLYGAGDYYVALA